ncbi:FxLYD domain-containing protein [Azotobacter salinestris]|uniref:FxLYD domain-containing protein n=1 Tax=Azotobacter salinestris TaxID=69964 RepID=UPI001FCBF671|nr:FxLYD domain-containing protein [Azotobacter salinestris]
MKIALMALLFSTGALAENDIKLRNMQLITMSHKTYLQETGVNVSGHDLENVAIDFDILKNGQVAGSRVIEARAIGADEAWRIWLPIDIAGSDGFRVRDIRAIRVSNGDVAAHRSH